MKGAEKTAGELGVQGERWVERKKKGCGKRAPWPEWNANVEWEAMTQSLQSLEEALRRASRLNW